MGTEKEKAENDQYVFRYRDDPLSQIITYKINVIEEIKRRSDTLKNQEIQNISSVREWKSFVEVAQKANYTIYKLRKI